MAMFELEDSETIGLNRCNTDGETLLKGKNLKGVVATDCEVKQSPELNVKPQSEARKFFWKACGWVMGIVAMVVAAGITAYFNFS